jgi:8-oxo-dGTP pyrophosphatase MutT (NUDIX family)
MDVDILDVNTFEKTHITKPIFDAWRDGDWIGAFNLWIAQNIDGIPSLLYQKRTSSGGWASGLLDVTAGGHYEASETAQDGLREVREEVGKTYEFEYLRYLGKKLYLHDDGNRKLRYVVDVFITLDNSPLNSFVLEHQELDGLYRCSIQDLIRVHTEPDYAFSATGTAFQNSTLEPSEILVTGNSFPFNWDRYHLKMALIAERFINNESRLYY